MIIPDNFRSILIIQLGPYGDVLLNTSYFSALRKKYPTTKIDFLVSKPYDSILYNNPYLSEILTIPKAKGIIYILQRIKTFIRIACRHYELVIDQQCGTGTGQICLFSFAKYRLGFENSKFAWLYNIKAKRGHKRYSASQKFDILIPLGIKEEPYKLYYYIKPESHIYIQNWMQEMKLEDKKFVCISPGSSVKRKKWKIEYFAELAVLIQTTFNLPVVILYAANEYEDAKKMYTLMDKKAILAPPTNFNQGAAMISHCRLLICNDGGLVHLSVATETPSLAIYGPTDANNWNPKSIFLNYEFLANPDAYIPSDNSFGVTVQQALDKIQQMLSGS